MKRTTTTIQESTHGVLSKNDVADPRGEKIRQFAIAEMKLKETLSDRAYATESRGRPKLNITGTTAAPTL
jgi:hypothetical protein